MAELHHRPQVAQQDAAAVVVALPWSEARTPVTGTVTIRNVFLHVTRACNLRCRYCYLSAGQRAADEMTTEEYARLWPELVALRPKKAIITGGEPLLRPDLLDLMRSLREADPEHRVLRCLNTNGQLVTPEIARQLVGLADEVRVSLDALRERNDALRGQGSFAAAMAALERLYAVGFEPKVMVTVTPFGLPDLTELLCFLAERNITRINLNPLRPVGRGSRYRTWRVKPEAVRAAVHEAWTRCYPDTPAPPDPAPEPRLNCGVGSFVNLMPNGDVFPCHVLTAKEFSCGSVREQSLAEICRRDGPLGALQALDFRVAAGSNKRLATLARTGGCMGEIEGDTGLDLQRTSA
jgi:MoaA/NifB/PqqE/SkfB family radical SAM enzyme